MGAVTAALSIILAACGAVAGSQPATMVASASPPPTAVGGASPSPTPPPTATPEASTAPSFTPAPAPQAELVTADATTAGTLGTFTIDDSGSDSPWLPFDSLPAVGLDATETPAIRFVDGVEIGQFQVEIAAAADTAGTSARAAKLGALAGDGRSFGVGPLPAGRWVLEARVFRADGRGDGLTFWAVTVR